MHVEQTHRQVGSSAVVAQLIDGAGGPVRRVGAGRRRRACGTFYSVKAGGPLEWESRNELHDLWRAEVRTDVVRSIVQPHTLQIVLGGKRRRYTPDRMDLLADGQIEIVEIKDAFEADADPDYTLKLAAARETYRGLGWRFRIRERKEIEAEPGFSVVREIQSWRRTAISAHDVELVRRLLRNAPAGLRFGLVASAFVHETVGLAKLCAMVVHRVVQVDFQSGHALRNLKVTLCELEMCADG